jgi:predicted nuclease of predicted toxin-antitoxin system
VKLLLDEDLSDKIVAGISDLFPDCAHVKSVALMRADDAAIADWARHHGFSIVSKDTDFYQRSVAFGSPPKFIWLRVGNCGTEKLSISCGGSMRSFVISLQARRRAS